MVSTEERNQDLHAINTIRVLAADVVQAANSGHPGAPMGMAPVAHVLFTKFFNADPTDHKWPNRDRFVLSNGHACVLQYILLMLLGYKMTIDDLKAFRQVDSKTPGHPEAHLTDGIEVTTGPLGQGISSAVGIAMAEAHLSAVFNKPNFSLIENYTYVFCGDGCLMEGVASEACSLAGHLKLGRLIVIYDDNQISIDGDTNLAFTEDVLKRYSSYGWHTLEVKDGDNDLEGIAAAIQQAKSVTDKPSMIKLRTTIGFGSGKQGTEKVHGAPLGADDITALKKKFGFNPDEKFIVSSEVQKQYREVRDRGLKKHQEWKSLLENYAKSFPDLVSDFRRRFEGTLPKDWRKALPTYTPQDAPLATRKLSETVLNKIADVLPELFGGSADLTGSNLTRWKNAVDFQGDTKLGNFSGRYIRYGVREHAMGAIANGLASYGGVIPFVSTFLNFVSYGAGALRLTSLSGFRVLWIATHDSIGLGEDGPTHQPISILAFLRGLPNTLVLRPADGNEVSAAYIIALENGHRPSIMSLTRQNLPQLDGSSIEKALRGGYTVRHGDRPQMIFVSTGSEVSICVDASKALANEGIQTSVVSLMSWEIFEEQDANYRNSIFPAGIPVLSVEALSEFGWHKYAHECHGMRTWGTSGPYKAVYEKFGFTTSTCVTKAKKVIEFYKGKQVPHLLCRAFP